MSKILTLASSSSGNCTYVGSLGGGLLVDAGISAKAITEGLAYIDVEPKSLCGIFVTHEHTDHIAGLRVFSNKYKIPVFASLKTAESLSELGIENLNVFESTVAVGDFAVTRFATSHDCEGSSGYTVVLPDGNKCAVCTDLGVMTDRVREALHGSVAMVIESNHDVGLLQKGTYPEHLKRRILSDKGHLSNVACATELGSMVENGTSRIILGHLSRENNRPAIARSTAVAALFDRKMKENYDYELYVAPPKVGTVVKF